MTAQDSQRLTDAQRMELRSYVELAGEVTENRAHGRDERVMVKSFYEGQEYLYRLVKMLAGGQ